MERIEVALADSTTAGVELHEELTSTNEVMRARFVDDRERFAPFHTIVAFSQTAGKGRLDREWVAPDDSAIAISTYLEFDAAAARTSIGWVALAAGVALREALLELAAAQSPGLAEDVAGRIAIKWPNDLLVDGRKVSGILGELLGVVDGGARFACVLGAGINLRTPEQGLAFPHAIALDEAGIRPERDALIGAFLRGFAARIRALDEAGGDASATGLRGELERHCTTIGLEVRVTRPQDADLVGVATGVDGTGALLVRGADGQVHPINVGDIEHVRPVVKPEEGE